jgi:hypothetical protein
MNPIVGAFIALIILFGGSVAIFLYLNREPHSPDEEYDDYY